LVQTDKRLLVRVNANDRAPSSAVIAPQNQEYFALRQCAAGKWCLREGDETRWGTNQYLIPGKVYNWQGPINIDTLLHHQNVEHHNCIYFLETEVFKELQFRMQCALDLQAALEGIYERKSKAFSSMRGSFRTFAAINQKVIKDKEVLPIHLAVVKLMVADAMDLRNLAAEEGLSVQKSSSRADKPTEGSSGHSEDATSEGKQAERTQQIIVFLTRCRGFHETLLQAYRVTPTRSTLQDLLLSTLEKDSKLVYGQFALSLLYRGNAQFILHRAVSAPQI
jgi:hypothetical protein